MFERKNAIILGAGFFILAIIYVFQQVNMAHYFFSWLRWERSNNMDFVFNKTCRLLINDLVCFAMIWLMFTESHHRRFAAWVFALEALIILPLYLILKLALEGNSEISSPLLSFIHRLIVNPMLMILTMAALGYQHYLSRKSS